MKTLKKEAELDAEVQKPLVKALFLYSFFPVERPRRTYSSPFFPFSMAFPGLSSAFVRDSGRGLFFLLYRLSGRRIKNFDFRPGALKAFRLSH